MRVSDDITPIMATNFVHVLRERAGRHPDREAFAFLSDGEAGTSRITYGDLDHGARALASFLQNSGLQGERAMLVFPPGLDFITAFFGCLYSAMTAVPVYPPRSRRLLDVFLRQVYDVNPRAILTVSALLPRLDSLDFHGVELIAIDILNGGAHDWRMPDLGADDLALIQYTSGSTATPKGVMVSHRNLIENQKIIQRAFSQDQHSIVVGWLPLYHDMGLIGNVLQPVFSGSRAILMPP
ncbi:MAG TPA: AMP-binding protein, partial [Bryobacteraceae bacterium]